MAADDAARGSAEDAMITGKVPRSAAHQRALDAAFGIGRRRYGDKCNRNRGAFKSLEVLFIFLLLGNRSRNGSGRPLNAAAAEKVPGERRRPPERVVGIVGAGVRKLVHQRSFASSTSQSAAMAVAGSG
jgi:hypothetical protein